MRKVLQRWLQERKSELPPRLNSDLLLKLLKLAMTQNVFRFGDTRWLQKVGTAMGAACAHACAALRPAHHE